MLQETNKFREHQSRELLIEILEQQNEEREKLITELEDKIQQGDALLSGGNGAANTIAMDESSWQNYNYRIKKTALFLRLTHNDEQIISAKS